MSTETRVQTDYCAPGNTETTRHDKAVARMVSEGQTHRQQVRTAVAGLRALRACIARRDRKPLPADEIRSAVVEGRR